MGDQPSLRELAQMPFDKALEALLNLPQETMRRETADHLHSCFVYSSPQCRALSQLDYSGKSKYPLEDILFIGLKEAAEYLRGYCTEFIVKQFGESAPSITIVMNSTIKGKEEKPKQTTPREMPKDLEFVMALIYDGVLSAKIQYEAIPTLKDLQMADSALFAEAKLRQAYDLTPESFVIARGMLREFTQRAKVFSDYVMNTYPKCSLDAVIGSIKPEDDRSIIQKGLDGKPAFVRWQEYLAGLNQKQEAQLKD